MKEKTFNKFFNAFILIGMTTAMVLVTAYKLSATDSGHLAIIIAAIGSLMGVLSTVCSANAKILTFIFGFFDVTLYGIMCFVGAKYGNAALHALYFVPMQFVGYFQWKKREVSSSGGKQALKARRLTFRQRWLYLGIFTASSVILYFVLLQFDKSAATSFLRIAIVADAVSTICNILGQFLMSTAYMEQWIFWIAVNVFTIIMWTSSLVQGSGDSSYQIIYIIKYSFYLLNSLNGLRIWLKLSSTGTEPSSSTL